MASAGSKKDGYTYTFYTHIFTTDTHNPHTQDNFNS